MSVTTDSDITGLGGSGGGVWGTITGTLADQTDLQAALDARVTGPGSATDEAIARYDGTTGKLLQNSLVSISDTGVMSLDSGALATPSLKFSADASDVGWYRSAAGTWSFATGSSTRVISLSSSGVDFRSTANPGTVTATVNGNNGTILWQYDANIGTWIIQNTSTGGDVIFRLANANTGGLGWAIDSLGSGAGDYVGGFVLSSDRSGAQVVMHAGKYDSVSLGGNNSILHRNSTTFVDRPQTTLTGTGTASASTTLTGSSTLFITQLAPGDRISVDGGSTFVTVLSIASNTSCTLDTAVTCSGASILRRSGTGFVDRTGTAWKGVLNDQGRLGLGLVNPASLIHIDGGDATASELRFTAGTTTGRTSSDGFQIGVTSSGVGEIRQRENLDLFFYTNNTARAVLKSHGRLTVGDTTETISFFLTDDTKLMASGDITSVQNLITIGAVSNFTVTPSADTNTGPFTVAIYTAQGFNTTLKGTHNFNGGLPIGGLTENISAFGAFGQTNVNTTSGTTDGVAGVLTTCAHQGYGGTVGDLFGGVFSASSGDEQGGGTPTGSVTGKAVGGQFAAYIDLNGVSIPTGIGGKFVEPFIVGGSGVFTNQVAAHIDGSIAITREDVASAASITNMDATTGFKKLTGTTATSLHGIHADAFNKFLFLYNATNQTLTLKHQSATDGTAANRIINKSGGDETIAAGGWALLVYDDAQSRWITALKQA